jgi:hypothetical protein
LAGDSTITNDLPMKLAFSHKKNNRQPAVERVHI